MLRRRNCESANGWIGRCGRRMSFLFWGSVVDADIPVTWDFFLYHDFVHLIEHGSLSLGNYTYELTWNRKN